MPKTDTRFVGVLRAVFIGGGLLGPDVFDRWTRGAFAGKYMLQVQEIPQPWSRKADGIPMIETIRPMRASKRSALSLELCSSHSASARRPLRTDAAPLHRGRARLAAGAAAMAVGGRNYF